MHSPNKTCVVPSFMIYFKIEIMFQNSNNSPVYIIFIALVILLAVSLLPLNKISGGLLKDFSFISDIVNDDESDEDVSPLNVAELDADIAEMLNNCQHDTIAKADTLVVAVEDTINIAVADSIEYTEPVIEDYTPGQSGLSHLKAALSQRNNRCVRIAFLGDSYIEGDILTQNIREILQDTYSGAGIGYTPIHSETPGFRRSVKQISSGWNIIDIKETTKTMPLSGLYCKAVENAKSQFKGTSKLRHLDSWGTTTLLFKAPTATDIKIEIAGQEIDTRHVEGSENVQAIVINNSSDNVKFSSKSTDMSVFGVYLNDASGIAVDNMPIRGYAGIRHHKISADLISQMRVYIDYDLIIVEYGINAISSGVLDYTYYKDALKKDILKIRECYPNADILLFGVGDRGEKRNGQVHTMKALKPMIKAQRQLAKELGILFWDTQLAMGGDDAIVEWTKNKDTNKDYIHLSFKGGERLGKIFTEQLITALEE